MAGALEGDTHPRDVPLNYLDRELNQTAENWGGKINTSWVKKSFA
jgi:hypothetical protein